MKKLLTRVLHVFQPKEAISEKNLIDLIEQTKHEIELAQKKVRGVNFSVSVRKAFDNIVLKNEIYLVDFLDQIPKHSEIYGELSQLYQKINSYKETTLRLLASLEKGNVIQKDSMYAGNLHTYNLSTERIITFNRKVLEANLTSELRSMALALRSSYVSAHIQKIKREGQNTTNCAEFWESVKNLPVNYEEFRKIAREDTPKHLSLPSPSS